MKGEKFNHGCDLLRWKPALTNKINDLFRSGKFKTSDTPESIFQSEDPEFNEFKEYGIKKFGTYFRNILSQYRRDNSKGKISIKIIVEIHFLF